MGDHRNDSRILGDINPTRDQCHSDKSLRDRHVHDADEMGHVDESMEGGSRHDDSAHSGSRDVTEGVTVGTGPE